MFSRFFFFFFPTFQCPSLSSFIFRPWREFRVLISCFSCPLSRAPLLTFRFCRPWVFLFFSVSNQNRFFFFWDFEVFRFSSLQVSSQLRSAFWSPSLSIVSTFSTPFLLSGAFGPLNCFFFFQPLPLSLTFFPLSLRSLFFSRIQLFTKELLFTKV